MESKDKRKVAVIILEYKPAVWFAAKQHIDLLISAGCEVSLFCLEETSSEFLKSNYRTFVFPNLIKLISSKYLKSVQIIWTIDFMTILKIYPFLIFKKKKIVYWVQGDVPAESFLRHRNKFREFVLRTIERMAFCVSKSYVFVSDSMSEYYEKKYSIAKKGKIVVPCLSEFADYKVQKTKIPNSFVYIGGMSAWQCFEKIVSLYKQIKTENTIFHIITLDVEKAKAMVLREISDTENIKIYSIKERAKIPEILSQFERGFLIREESSVNFVSSPIKFLEYLSCNVDVIISKTIPSYAKIVEEEKVGLVLKSNDKIKALPPFSGNARKVYTKMFDKSVFVDRYKRLIYNM